MVELLQALLTPTIAVTTTYIAYQQYRIRKDERALVLYDRRLRIYKNAISIVDKVFCGHSISEEEPYLWIQSLNESAFLFGKEVQEVISPLFGVLMEFSHECSNEVSEDGTWNMKRFELMDKVESFRTPLTKVFAPYLKPQSSMLFGKWRITRRKARKLTEFADTPSKYDDKLDEDVPF